MYTIELYKAEIKTQLFDFFEKCLPESGRCFNLQMQHKSFQDIENNFEKLWCLFDDDKLIGTVALRKINDSDCELKSLYLFDAYQGKRLGYKLISTAIDYAKNSSYKRMFLDTLSTSTRALMLYEKIGFKYTERYNNAVRSDVFMVLSL